MKRTAVENWKQSHDAVIPPVTPAPEPEPETVKASKTRLSAQIATGIANLARNAVYATPELTLSRLIEEAIAEKIQRLEKERGEPFPQRLRELPTGRPYKVR
jgi:hypothetical protein